MNTLYPLKFKPVFKTKIWGGDKISKYFTSSVVPASCGEAWVLSGYKTDMGVVSNGFLAGNRLDELIEVYMGDLLGDTVFERYGSEFPLLVKLIDANDWLSIQVHPGDEMAEELHQGYGKNEMWYVMEAREDSTLINGFNTKVTPGQYLQSLASKSLSSIMQYQPVKAGSVVDIPAGRVHAMGPGLLIAEIQQSSDLTYRIFDFDRVDPEGNPRELHTDLALKAIDFDNQVCPETVNYHPELNHTVPLVKNRYFNTGLLHFGTPIAKDYNEVDSFVILMGVEGMAAISYAGGDETISAGEAILLPAFLKNIVLIPKPEAKIMEIYIPE